MTDGDSTSTAKVVGLVGLVISVVAGAVALLFTLEPDLKPCIGGAEVSFTGAPIFPNTPLHTNLEHTNTPRSAIQQAPDDIGAEVRFSFRASGLRGELLKVQYSLVRVERDGTLGRVDPEQDRAEGLAFKPDTCSEVEGGDLFVMTPPDPRHRYRVVLELYRGDDFTQRLALTETATFSG
jgi:hypothetical protein